MIRIVKKNISGNAFCLLPENFLYAMVLSEEEHVRIKGLETILHIRDAVMEREPAKKIPDINWEASHWSNLIDLSAPDGLWEPTTTRIMSRDEIVAHMEAKTTPKLTPLPGHSQSVERSMKLVSKASRTVYGLDNRHKSILTKMLGREKRPTFESKGSYKQDYDDIF